MMDLPFDFYRNKTVFITGHTGFKGSWMCRILLLAGAKIIGYSLQPPSRPNLYELINLQNDVNSIIADIRNIDALKKAIVDCTPDMVFHMAAQPIVRESYINPVYTYETNVMGTVNLLEACRNTNSIKSIVNVTTDKVYENKEWYWSYRENEPLCGHDPYSNSKSCSELVTHSYKNAFFNSSDSPAISTVRSGNVIGGGDFANDRIIPDCVRAVSKGEKITVRNPYSVRPYQHVLDTLFGYLLLGCRQYEDKSIGSSYNFGPDYEDCITTGELVKLFCDRWRGGLSWEIKRDDGPHEADFLKLDCSKAKSVLKWRAMTDIKKAVDYTVEWSRDWIEGHDLTESMDRQITAMQGVVQ